MRWWQKPPPAWIIVASYVLSAFALYTIYWTTKLDQAGFVIERLSAELQKCHMKERP